MKNISFGPAGPFDGCGFLSYDAPMVEKSPLDYQRAGVNIDEGNKFVKMLTPLVRETHRPEVLSDIGGFGGLFCLDLKKYRQPVLVSGTDGVGTKLKLSFLLNQYNTIGIDLVAMCVNDVAVVGAEPLFFLDYLSVGKLEAEQSLEVMKGIVEGCKQAGCSLLGGETAEMPSFYQEGEFDLAGFCVGVVDKEKMINGRSIKAGDQIIGFASSGLHSNGFSLVRKLLLEQLKMPLDGFVPELKKNLGEELMTPTRIYVKSVLKLVSEFPVKGIAHITGGGLTENVPRILPKGLSAVIRRESWETPSIFGFLSEKGELSETEMFRVFNMGIGLIMVVPGGVEEGMLKAAKGLGEKAFLIGKISEGSGQVCYG